MARENHVQPDRVQPEQRHRGDRQPGPQDGKNQGIVRDERGQEQPADKERAQRVHKTKEGPARG